MRKKAGLAFGGLLFVPLFALGVAQSWPMANPDTEPFMEILPPSSDAEARPHTKYTARDGTDLPLRVYEATDSDTALIMMHGAGLYGDYLYPLASHLASQSTASVYVPDLRGHGDSPEPRGDIDYVDQLVDDLADLVAYVRAQREWEHIVIGGHSMGGGLAVRFGGTDYAHKIDGYLLIAPLLSYDAPTMSEEHGGYIHPNLPRFMALSLWNALGITAFDGTDVFLLHPPDEVADERVTTRYSWRQAKGMTTLDYVADLSAIEAPLLLVTGDEDEMFNSEEYAPIIEKYVSHGEVVIKPGFNHVTDVLNEPAALDAYSTWLKSFDE